MSDSRNPEAIARVPTKKLKLGDKMSGANDSSTIQTGDDFEVLKEYLLACPDVSSDSPAIKAALEGIEKEQKRRIRDAKLRSKFGATKYTSKSSACDEIVVVEKDDFDGNKSQTILEASAVTNATGPLAASSSHEDDMEWQDVSKQKDNDDPMASSGSAVGDSFILDPLEESSTISYLGKTLAKACIDTIALQQKRNKPVAVSTPFAAVAVALHAALRSETLGFACTGIPEGYNKGKKSAGSIGFAPPVRELPKTQFLPKAWDNCVDTRDPPLPLRYRKLDTGAVILRVEGLYPNDDNNEVNLNRIECKVTFMPANTKGDSTNTGMKFPLSEHINLDSWNAAMMKARGPVAKTTTPNNQCHKIAPSLHYKNLSGLLSKFCRAFDLGAVNSGEVDTTETPTGLRMRSNDAHTNKSCDSEHPRIFPQATAVPSPSTMIVGATESRHQGFAVPSTVDQAFPSAASAARGNLPPLRMDQSPRGDFATDLLPAGLQDPRFGIMGGRPTGTGNLMGPRHPMFSPGGIADHYPPMGGGGLASGGPGTMQPRYDPILPPGIGGGEVIPGNGRHQGTGNNRRGRVRGEPNPDHLPPPNSLGDNSMFM